MGAAGNDAGLGLRLGCSDGARPFGTAVPAPPPHEDAPPQEAPPQEAPTRPVRARGRRGQERPSTVVADAGRGALGVAVADLRWGVLRVRPRRAPLGVERRLPPLPRCSRSQCARGRPSDLARAGWLERDRQPVAGAVRRPLGATCLRGEPARSSWTEREADRITAASGLASTVSCTIGREPIQASCWDNHRVRRVLHRRSTKWWTCRHIGRRGRLGSNQRP